MQTVVVGSYRWKTKDLDRLPEEPFLSYEIIDGELIVSRRPHLRHAAIIGKRCAQVYVDRRRGPPRLSHSMFERVLTMVH